MRPPLQFTLALLVWLGGYGVAGAATRWPAPDPGLAFGFSDYFSPAHALDGEGAAMPGWRFTPTGYGRVRHDGALLLGRGGFAAPRVGDFLTTSLTGKSEITLALGIDPDKNSEDGPILSLTSDGAPWLVVAQRDGALRIQLATEKGLHPIDLGQADTGKATNLAFVRDAMDFVVYQDGAEVSRGQLPTPMAQPQALALHLGGSDPDVPGWMGAVDGLALYARAFNPGDIEVLHHALAQRRLARPEIPTLRVRATLRGMSTVLSPDDLAPYTRGLTVFRYDVNEVLSGSFGGKHLHVAHWTVLDSRPVPFAALAEGAALELALTPFDDNPQLAAENLSDDIVEDFSIPYYYDAGGRALRGAIPGRLR